MHSPVIELFWWTNRRGKGRPGKFLLVECVPWEREKNSREFLPHRRLRRRRVFSRLPSPRIPVVLSFSTFPRRNRSKCASRLYARYHATQEWFRRCLPFFEEDKKKAKRQERETLSRRMSLVWSASMLYRDFCSHLQKTSLSSTGRVRYLVSLQVRAARRAIFFKCLPFLPFVNKPSFLFLPKRKEATPATHQSLRKLPCSKCWGKKIKNENYEVKPNAIEGKIKIRREEHTRKKETREGCAAAKRIELRRGTKNSVRRGASNRISEGEKRKKERRKQFKKRKNKAPAHRCFQQHGTVGFGNRDRMTAPRNAPTISVKRLGQEIDATISTPEARQRSTRTTSIQPPTKKERQKEVR